LSPEIVIPSAGAPGAPLFRDYWYAVLLPESFRAVAPSAPDFASGLSR
jgi:hypothetical protein